MADQKSDALIRLLSAECDFADCSFQSPAGSPELVAAIVWQHASSARAAADGLPTGRIRLNNCVFRRVGVGVESHRRGAIGLELVNSLCLGPGPMIRLMHAPAADEPVRIRLAQVTLREAESLLDCRGIDPPDSAGAIAIEASGCVLAPRTQAALLVLTADAFPGPLLHEVKWTGQGSVVAGQVVVGRWCGADGTCQTVDDATLSIAGLVRGEVEFAGRFNGQPANSQVLNCQAPLRDSDSLAPPRAICRRRSSRHRTEYGFRPAARSAGRGRIGRASLRNYLKTVGCGRAQRRPTTKCRKMVGGFNR